MESSEEKILTLTFKGDEATDIKNIFHKISTNEIGLKKSLTDNETKLVDTIKKKIK